MTQVHKSPLRRGAVSRLREIDQLLAEAYGTPESTLDNKDDPLDEAIYIILSFQTDLKRFSRRGAACGRSFRLGKTLRRRPFRYWPCDTRGRPPAPEGPHD